MRRGQATRQMKGFAYLRTKITSKISISSRTYVQSASKQTHRYGIIILLLRIPLGITLFGEPSDYLMNVMQLRCDEYESYQNQIILIASQKPQREKRRKRSKFRRMIKCSNSVPTTRFSNETVTGLTPQYNNCAKRSLRPSGGQN